MAFTESATDQSDTPQEQNPHRDPVFLLGIMPRSGTNYVYNLIRLHPDCNCVTDEYMVEDYLVFHANLLTRYADVVCNYWGQFWSHQDDPPMTKDVYQTLKNRLCKSLGDGLISYFDQPGDRRRVITKTPSVRNLNYFFKLFPNAQLIILIRDGRSVVESAVKSFGYSYEDATQRWAAAAQTIIEFEQAHQDVQSQYLIVKYEDVLDNIPETLTKIFEFAGVNASAYDFDNVGQLPVMGSSAFYNTGGWKRVSDAKNFNPRQRWSSWSDAQMERFYWIAGDAMVKLGYVDEAERAEHSPKNSVWHSIRDQKWRLKDWVQSKTYSLEKLLYGIYLYKGKFKRFPIQD
ncbi:MAG: sulfotransferase family protein [Elainellaceae cyanobacterium]